MSHILFYKMLLKHIMWRYFVIALICKYDFPILFHPRTHVILNMEPHSDLFNDVQV